MRTLSLIMAALAVGCGDSGGSGGDTGSESDATESTSASTSTATNDTTAEVSSATEVTTDSTSSTMGTTETVDDSTSSDTGNEGGDGQLIVDPDYPAWFKYDGAGSHFLCGPGDPEDFLYRGTENADGTRDGDQQDIIDKLAPTGANAIYFQAVRSNGGDGDGTHNPFVDHGDPSSGLNDAVLDQWDGWLTALDEAGVVSYFFIYDDGANPFGAGDTVGADERTFIEGLVDRFEDHELLVWVIGEEYSEAYSVARVSAIAQVITDSDDLDHPIGNHQLTGLNFDHAGDPNINQFTIQFNQGTAAALHTGMVQAFGDANGNYNLNMSETAMHGAGMEAREKNWASAMGGAYVMVLEWDVATTAVSDLEQCGYLVDFFESTRFREMAPDDALALDDTQYVLHAAPEIFIAYSNTASTALGLGSLEAGDYDLHWLDAISGNTVDETITAVDGDNSFPLPNGFGAEVAVYAEQQ